MWAELLILPLFATSLAGTLYVFQRLLSDATKTQAESIATAVSAILNPVVATVEPGPPTNLGMDPLPMPEWMENADSPDLLDWNGRPLSWEAPSEEDSVTTL